jgi:hypothetical protein
MNAFLFSMVRRLGRGWLAGLVVFCLAVALKCSAQPITNTALLVAFDFDADGTRDASFEQWGHRDIVSPPYYSSGVFLRNSNQLRFLQGTTKEVDFAANQVISRSSKAYVSPGEDNYVTLLAYDSQFINFVEWRFIDPGFPPPENFYTNKTEVLIGFRLTSRDLGTKHHGWLKFTRPDTRITTPFAVAGYDWNPLPDEPIAAGQPPMVPLAHEATAEGLKLSWPSPMANWVLESSETLGAAEVWRPVPEANGAGTGTLLPPPDGTRFYRLRRP